MANIQQKATKGNLDANTKKQFDINDDLEVAEYILKNTDLFFYKQMFYTYENHYWHPINDDKIKSIILNLLLNKYNQKRKNNILDILKIKTLKEADDINLNAKKRAINLQNGIFYIDEKKLVPHSEETKNLYSTNLFPINYEPNAKYERWNQFVKEIFEPDHDQEDKIKLLQEYLGYCLTQDVSFQKAVLMLGDGSNGKSIIMQILENILGKENYSNIELNQLSNRYYVTELLNKNVNFCSEIDYKSQFSSSMFKKIIGGDTLPADIKFKSPIKFRPYCKLLLATNDLPRTNDTTFGYFRRIIILKFNRRFTGKEKDNNLKGTLEMELNGIFNWMLNGIERLYSNKKFTIPPSSDEESLRYLENSNSVVSFINEKCIIDKHVNTENYERYDYLYEKYRLFCSESGDKPFKKRNFRNEIEKQYPGQILFSRIGSIGNHFQNLKYNGDDITL